MSKIFVTGDFHGHLDIHKINMLNWPEQKELDSNDILIQLGDFGNVWANPDSKRYKQDLYWRDWLGDKPFMFAFVDGNHCLSDDTEVLTIDGFEKIKELIDNNVDVKIAQFDIPSSKISYDYPIQKIKKYVNEKLVEINSHLTSSLVTDGHDMIINGEKIKAKHIESGNYNTNQIPRVGYCENLGVDISDNWIKLLTWVIMDATMVDHSKYKPNSKKKRIQFKLSKQRKIEVLTDLLDEMKIPYTLKESTKSPTNKLQPYYIRIYGQYSKDIWKELNGIKQIPYEWKNFNKSQLEVFLETLAITDGSRVKKTIKWTSIDFVNVNIIQECCIKNGFIFKYSKNDNRSGFDNGKTQYHCTIYKNKNYNMSYRIKTDRIQYDGYVYCYTMPLGTLITRRKGKINFIGNCNFDLLNQFPIIEKWGGRVHIIETNNKPLYHLMRGEVYNINGKKCIALGGAESQDKQYRIEGVSWWKEETWNSNEIEYITNQIIKNQNIEIVLAHTCPKYAANMMFNDLFKGNCATAKDMDQLYGLGLKPKEWHFGHYHKTKKIMINNTLYMCHYNGKPHEIGE